MHEILKNTFFACVLGMVTSDQATANCNLASARPAINGIVEVPPTQLELRFSDALNVKFSGVKIIGAANATVVAGVVSFAKGSKRILIVPVLTTLVAGTYRVHWHLLSKDGHKSHDNYTFTVKP